MSETFESIVNAIPKREKSEDTFTIALGDYFPGSESVLTFCKLKAAFFFGGMLEDLYTRIKNQKCQEEDITIIEMAFIIGSHAEPPAERPELLVPGYIYIFDNFTEIQKWQFVQEFKNKGGGEFLEKMIEVVQQKKSNIEAEMPPEEIEQNTKSSVSASVTSSATRPKRPLRSTKSRTLPLTTP